jgi:hypothetical protein
MSRKAEFNIRLYDKNSKLDYFFFLHQNQNIFFSNIGKQDIFFEKNHNHPFKLNGFDFRNIFCVALSELFLIVHAFT